MIFSFSVPTLTTIMLLVGYSFLSPILVIHHRLTSLLLRPYVDSDSKGILLPIKYSSAFLYDYMKNFKPYFISLYKMKNDYVFFLPTYVLTSLHVSNDWFHIYLFSFISVNLSANFKCRRNTNLAVYSFYII